MKTKPIPKELIDKIELRVEDFQIPIPTKANYGGFEGYLLKDVLVPYVDGKRTGYFTFQAPNSNSNYYDVRYVVTHGRSGKYRFSRVAYIMLNKDDPRVIETENHYDIADNLMVDHHKDEEAETKYSKFSIKADREKNLKLLTNSENVKKQRKKKNNLPIFISFDLNHSAWHFRINPALNQEPKTKSFAILKHGYVGAYLKVIDHCNKITGSNHIPDLNHIDETLPPDYKTMTEREFFEKYAEEYKRQSSLKHRKKKQINPDDELDLGLSLA